MNRIVLLGLGLLVVLGTFTSVAAAAEVRIFAAASLTEAVKEVVAVYRQQHPEELLLPNFASSGALAKQIAAGAPADIYISANPKWLHYVRQQGLLVEASERVLVRNRLVFVGLAERIKALADLPQLQRIALGSPNAVPAGRYAEQALTSAGLYAQLQAQQKLVLAKDVRQALLFADRGEVDGAFVYRTDALLARQARILFEVPPELYPQIVYPAALTRAAAGNAAANEFFAYLFSDEAQRILRRYGFLLPEQK